MTGAGVKPSFFDQFALGSEFKRAYTPVAEPCHPHSVQLIEFWHEKESTGGLVVGRDIPSKAISGILRNLIVYEPIADCSDFRVRHAGTAYIAHYGIDVTGKLMSELFDAEIFRYNRAKAAEVIRSERPEVFDANLSQFGITRRHYEVMLLPVFAPDKNSRWLLCGIFRFE
jgi:hypothetical protein